MINWVDKRYPNSGGIWITENGYSLEDSVTDVDRYQNIRSSFNEILKAIEVDKVQVHGTCIWSMMDNFEWTAGYTGTIKYLKIYLFYKNPKIILVFTTLNSWTHRL